MSIKVITSKDFSEFDLNEIKQLFDEVGLEITITNEKMIEKSEELVSAIWFSISIPAVLIAKPFFTGFFNRMGEDAYTYFKKIIIKISQKQKRQENIQFRFIIKKDDERMIILPLPTDNLKIALDALPEFLDNNLDLNEWIIFDQGKWKRLSDR
ncbi:MAG: hypothetical protein OXC46_01045 [Thaumarchaeota archaeon]|nr:hypothetical protein [Nitrososphaerota archaeon]